MLGSKRKGLWIGLSMVVALAVIGFTATDTGAHERYKNFGTPGTNCSECHGDFPSDVSPKGTVFPSGNKHTMHRGSQYMNTECDLCHTSNDGNNPFIGSSDGTADTPGLGCVGCHGREEDMGNDFQSPGRGAGLRQHHVNAGVNVCAGCHGDASPATYTPVGEDVKPAYYGSVDTNVDNPCNTVAASDVNENWSVGDFVGMDNDGDGLYDGADSACTTSSPSPGEVSPQMSVTGKNPGAGQLTVQYDTTTCQATEHSLAYGSLGSVATYGYTGAVCSIGSSGTYVWSYDPGSVFFLIVANDGSMVEGSYGKDSDATERPQAATCGLNQDLPNRCD